MKTFFALAGLLGCAGALAAEPPPAAPFPYFVANCFNCHGTEGNTKSAIPAIAGRERAYLEATLKAFKDGSKQATIMHQLAKGYTDGEIAVLADYFSRQR